MLSDAAEFFCATVISVDSESDAYIRAEDCPGLCAPRDWCPIYGGSESSDDTPNVAAAHTLWAGHACCGSASPHCRDDEDTVSAKWHNTSR